MKPAPVQKAINESLGKAIKAEISKFLIKRTDDFMQIPSAQIQPECQDIELQCEGYSLFNPDLALSNFTHFLHDISKKISSNPRLTIHALKINFNGFKLKQGCIRSITDSIKKMNKNVKILVIHTSDLENATQNDFILLLRLMLGIGENNNSNFQEFSLQCANWTFREAQPCLVELFENNILQNGERQKLPRDILFQRRIRLELSGWWSNASEAKAFLGFALNEDQLKKISQNKRQFYRNGQGYDKQKFEQRIGFFHLAIQQMIQNLLQMMENIEILQVDLRNNSDILQMKKLKQQIISKVSKKNKQQKSIISMRQTVNVSNREDSESKGLRINIAV